MRPITLAIEGVRSFRAPVSISFEGRDHLAIVGDTGAGKSSILEAMTYALYGRTTFSGQANQEVMNDLAGHARVTLRFTVAGGVFEVTRALRRAADRTVGAARASLTEFAPDGSEARKIEGVRQVDHRVQEILGLDARAFLRTVVLPQGQFAQLLVGDDPSARAEILRQVWRADELARAGQLAEEALPAISELAGRVTQALDGAPDNPTAHLERLRDDAGKLAARAQTARDAHRAAADARDSLARATQRSASAQSVRGNTSHFDLDDAERAARQAAGLAAAIAAERAALESQRAAARARLQAVPADEDGLGHQSIGAAQATIAQLPGRAEAAQDAAARARADAADSADEERRAATLQTELEAIDVQLSERDQARQRLDSEVADAEAKLARAQDLLRDARTDVAAAEDLREQADGKAAQAEALKEEIVRLHDGNLIPAEQRLAKTEGDYLAAQRRNAGAAASHGLSHGDDCPVCSRPLPADWAPLAAEDLDTAREASQEARDELAEAQGTIRGLTIRAEEMGAQARELRQKADSSFGAAGAAAASIALLLGYEERDPVSLLRDEAVAQPLSDAVGRARASLAEHDSHSQGLREKRTAADVGAAGARAALKKAADARSRSSRNAITAVAALRSDLASLPLELGVAAALPDDPIDIDIIQIAGADAASRLLSERSEELRRRAALRSELGQTLDSLADGLGDLDARRADEVHAPADEIAAAANRHRDTLAEGVALLGLEGITLPPAVSSADPARLEEAVRALRAATDAATRQALALAETSASEATAARKTLARVAQELAITTAGADAPEANMVAERADGNATDAEVEARAAAAAAENFAPLAGPLAALRCAGDELDLAHRVVRDLSAALKPGAFPKWLTLRRSRALLVHASRLLEQMSSGRYAFAEISDESAEWQIVDLDSNLARTPASLSGGEQFLASLSLALGMVEMMARSGGRLESLWLDEGFGSLDRTNLDAAVEALASVSARGRMVAVITHIRAVADQVDHVLAVTRAATGSQAKWLGPSQRAHLAADDLGGEAADALSGLLE